MDFSVIYIIILVQEIRFSLVVIFHVDKNHHERNVVVYVFIFG